MLHNEKLDNSSCDFERCGLCEKLTFSLVNPRSRSSVLPPRKLVLLPKYFNVLLNQILSHPFGKASEHIIGFFRLVHGIDYLKISRHTLSWIRNRILQPSPILQIHEKITARNPLSAFSLTNIKASQRTNRQTIPLGFPFVSSFHLAAYPTYSSSSLSMNQWVRFHNIIRVLSKTIITIHNSGRMYR